MTTKPLKTLYLVHDLSDSTVHKRVLMLKDGGADVTIMGFHRSIIPPTQIHGCPTIGLGKTYDGKFIHRVLATLYAVFILPKYKNYFVQSDIIIARTLEMLAISVRGRILSPTRPVLVYECLDIHRLLLKTNFIGSALRTFEGWLSRRASLLITSSPAFIHEYFLKRSSVTCPIYLLENKIYQSIPTPQPILQRASDLPWRIGWFGAIRCRKSLDILSSLVRHMNGKVEVIIRGKPSLDQFDDFTKQTSHIDGLSFKGPYTNPDDLEKIYGDVHFTWAIDMFEEGLNSSWLLPNRIYEGSYYGSIPLTQSDVETGLYTKKLGMGVHLHSPLEQNLIKFFEHLTSEHYQSLQQETQSTPPDTWILTKKDSINFVTMLSGLRNTNNE